METQPKDGSHQSHHLQSKGKGQPATGRGGPRGSGQVKARIFLTFGTTRVVDSHTHRPPLPQGTWFHRREPRKKSPVTPQGIDPGTVGLVAQYLNHYATPGPPLLHKDILIDDFFSLFPSTHTLSKNGLYILQNVSVC